MSSVSGEKETPGNLLILRGGLRVGWSLIRWLTTSFEEAKHKEIEINCEYCSRNEGKHSGQLPHCIIFFVVLLAFGV